MRLFKIVHQSDGLKLLALVKHIDNAAGISMDFFMIPAHSPKGGNILKRLAIRAIIPFVSGYVR